MTATALHASDIPEQMDISQPVLVEAVLSSTSFAILLGYHALHFAKLRRWPRTTSTGLNAHARRLWVEHIMHDKADILAVQTMRNWTMAATFLASTAIVLGLGFLNFALTSQGLNELSLTFNRVGVTDHALAIAKALAVASTFLFAFVQFMLAVRFYNHAAFLINVPQSPECQITPAVVSDTINRGARHYSIGMRAYYVAIPTFLWLLGPIWLFLATILMTRLSWRLDHGLG
jgi:uncharacterized membrane protein